MHVKPVRYQNQHCLPFITFSCYRRMQLLDSPTAKETFERTLERVRVWYGCYIAGYVVMPEHVHLLISEPERSILSVAIQMLKQITSQRLHAQPLPRFWQVRYYDFPVWSEAKRIEKLRYGPHGGESEWESCSWPDPPSRKMRGKGGAAQLRRVDAERMGQPPSEIILLCRIEQLKYTTPL